MTSNIMQIMAITKAKLTRNATPAERLFMRYLKELRIKYRFQEAFLPRVHIDKQFRVVDFYVPQAGLIFEIDGKHHKKKYKQDVVRENEIRDKCAQLLIVRFTNDEVFNEPEKVKNAVLKIFQKRTTTDWRRPKPSAWDP